MSKKGLSTDTNIIESSCAQIDSQISGGLSKSKNAYKDLNSLISSSKSMSIDELENYIKAYEKVVEASVSMLSNVSEVIRSMSKSIEEADKSLEKVNKMKGGK